MSSKGTEVTHMSSGEKPVNTLTSRSARVQVQGPALKVTALSAVTRLQFGLLAESLSHSQERSCFLPRARLLPGVMPSAPSRHRELIWVYLQISQPCCFLKGSHKKASVNDLGSALTEENRSFVMLRGTGGLLYLQLQGSLPAPLSQCRPACPAPCRGVGAFLAHTIPVVPQL